MQSDRSLAANDVTNIPEPMRAHPDASFLLCDGLRDFFRPTCLAPFFGFHRFPLAFSTRPHSIFTAGRHVRRPLARGDVTRALVGQPEFRFRVRTGGVVFRADWRSGCEPVIDNGWLVSISVGAFRFSSSQRAGSVPICFRSGRVGRRPMAAPKKTMEPLFFSYVFRCTWTEGQSEIRQGACHSSVSPLNNFESITTKASEIP